jgi:hypothetical protein
MTRRHMWASLREQHLSTSEQWAAYARARATLDACWIILCREGLCVWWVSPDSSHRDYVSGVGPVDCPCKRNDP